MLILAALAALLVSAAPAHAGPLIVPILTAVGVAAGVAQVIGAIASVALSIGISLLFKPKQQSVQDPGVELDIRMDADVPESLVVGRAVLAGSRIYAETYGASGSTQNTNLIEKISLADHPCEGLVTQFVEAQECDLTDTGTSRGYTVDGYDGNLALKFFDGSQTSADAYAVAALGSHPERPWTSSHVGYGRTYARTHYIYNREKITGPLGWKFVLDGIRLYDPRYDTSVGGSGTQRFDDLDTHVFTRNLLVIAYNIVRSIRVKDHTGAAVHFYGLRTPASDAPLDNWIAAMNEADVDIDLAGGGTEKQFWGGLEIPISTEPRVVLRKIMDATGCTFVENAGVWKAYAGAPGLPVASYDDSALLANKPNSRKLLTPLENKITYVTGSFTSPDDGWITKTAPPRIDDDQETKLGRRVDGNIDAPMVQSPTHMQRVMLQVLNRAKRQRVLNEPLPRALFGVEPGDVVERTYGDQVDKLFLIETSEIDVNLITIVSMREVDETDWNWSTTDEITQAVASFLVSLPAAKIINGLDVFPYTHVGDTGIRKASARVIWTPPEDDDITGLILQLRLQSDPTEVATLPTVELDEIAAGETRLIGGFASLTDYALRGRWKSGDGWATEWSLWIPFTTTDARVSEAALDAQVQAWLQQLDSTREAALAPILAALDAKVSALGQTTAGIVALLNERIDGPGENSIVNYIGNTNTSVTEVKSLADGLALMFIGASISGDLANADALFQMAAGTSPSGTGASIKLTARASIDELFKEAGLEIYAELDAAGGASGVVLRGDKALVQPPTGDPLNLLLVALQDAPQEIAVTDESGDDVIRADLAKRLQHYTSTITGATQMRVPNNPAQMDYKHDVVVGNDGAVLDFSDEFDFPHPKGMSTVAGATNRFDISISKISPNRATAQYLGTFAEALVFERRDKIQLSGTSASAVVDFSTLDFVAGNLLLVTVAMHTSGSGNAISAPTLTGWDSLAFHAEGTGFGYDDKTGVRAFCKIADGTETAVAALNGTGTDGWTAEVEAFKVLGGDVYGVATAVGSHTTNVSQTIAATDAPRAPALAFGMGTRDLAAAVTMSWSGTAEVDDSDTSTSLGSRYMSELLDPLADIDVTVTRSSTVATLVCGYLYLN